MSADTAFTIIAIAVVVLIIIPGGADALSG